MEKCIITACSNRFFPSVLNLIGSIKANYPNHPKIYVYSLGLFTILKNELKNIKDVEVIDMPHFCPFWKKCYTWKPYIFNNPITELNIFIDAGSQILRPLDEIFEQILTNEYFAVSQGGQLEEIIPQEYKRLLNLKAGFEHKTYIGSGVFGFKKSNEKMRNLLSEIYEEALCGLCLGFSAEEQGRNKGKNKTFFIRGCKVFRHEQTLLNIKMVNEFGNFRINDLNKFAGLESPHEHPEQVIWSLRRNYKKLEYADKNFTKNKNFKKLLLNLFFILLDFKKKVTNLIKNHA